MTNIVEQSSSKQKLEIKNEENQALHESDP